MTSEEWTLIGVAGVVGLYLLSRRTADSVGGMMGSGGTVKVRLTGYWPFQPGLSPAQRLMEGGQNDRMGNPLHTLEDFQAGQAPYVSVSGDQDIWPYGQRLDIDNWPGIIFRVVDTGSHFHGVHKVFRVAGYEPLDICVAGPDTVIDPKLSSVNIVAGDSFAVYHDKGTVADVQTQLLPDQG